MSSKPRLSKGVFQLPEVINRYKIENHLHDCISGIRYIQMSTRCSGHDWDIRGKSVRLLATAFTSRLPNTCKSVRETGTTIMKTDYSDMFEPRHNSFEKEEDIKLDEVTKWMIAVFFVLLVAGIIIGNHYGFNHFITN